MSVRGEGGKGSGKRSGEVSEGRQCCQAVRGIEAL